MNEWKEKRGCETKSMELRNVYFMCKKANPVDLDGVNVAT